MIVRSHFQTGWTHFWMQLGKVIKNPIFLTLTVLGNAMLLLCSSIFYVCEQNTNPNVRNYGDALWWAFVTITSVGYGDTVPITTAGRIVAVVLMLTGGVLFLSFIALLSSAFIELEFLELESKVQELRSKLKEKDLVD